MYNKYIMKTISAFLIITLLFTACKTEEKKQITEIDFKRVYQFNSEIENKLKTDTTNWKYQMSASNYAQKGNYKKALDHYNLAMPSKPTVNYTNQEIDSIKQLYTTASAVDFIINEAKNHQVVIINEAHHVALHRNFAKSLLQKLYNIGFTNMGFETLSYRDKAINTRKYPVDTTGYYSQEPQFGNLIRKALKIGYYVFPYETKNFSNGVRQREIDQAKAIDSMIKLKPDEKFLIYCGYDHNLEGQHPFWENTMATNLISYSGINPLTINQTKYTERGNAELNDKFFNVFNVTEPTVLIDKTTNKALPYTRKKGFSDIAVIHPKTSFINNRPNWLFNNNVKQVSLDLNEITLEFPVMVYAFYKNEDIHTAVPADIVEVKDNTQPITLALEKVDYTIVVTDRNKKSISYNLSVD